MTLLAISWTGGQRGVSVRFYDREGAPGAWERVRGGCPCGKDGRAAERDVPDPYRALVPARGNFGYEIDAPASARIINAVAIDAGLMPALGGQEPADNPDPGFSALVDTGAATKFPPQPFLTRADWGADEGKRFGPSGAEVSPPQFFPVQALTVHHTVTANDDPDPAATVRSIYEFHTTGNGWGDIGYNFLIDGQGRIYEGRWSGKDGIPAHDADNMGVTGFHTAGFNAGMIGIALLGDFTGRPPTSAMRRSLAGLLASLGTKHDLDPRSAITYRNPLSGQERKAQTLAGHRDWTLTECPGSAADTYMRDLRAEVARLMA
ncbi:N-acetylmuramoyl-L-alanine amidase [Streptomyces massasporeus]|uniref:N-acetylmuramoyl-L-alanine amidase n=1 Tax=Streptomyces massasporeus TaxID=67324 RepID=UPI0037A229D7